MVFSMYLYYAIAYEKWVHLEWLKTLNLHNLKEEVEWVSVPMFWLGKNVLSGYLHLNIHIWKTLMK